MSRRGELELLASIAIDPGAGEVGAERNLVYPGPRGRRGFPICEEPGCRRESCGPFSYGCVEHWSEENDERDRLGECQLVLEVS